MLRLGGQRRHATLGPSIDKLNQRSIRSRHFSGAEAYGPSAAAMAHWCGAILSANNIVSDIIGLS